MTSTTTRIITIALAALALAAPVAAAKPMPEYQGPHPSTVSGTDSASKQDLRNADRRVTVVPAQQPQTMKPVVITHTKPAPADDDNGVSPFVFIVPGLVLIAMLAAGFGYTRLSRRPASA